MCDGAYRYPLFLRRASCSKGLPHLFVLRHAMAAAPSPADVIHSVPQSPGANAPNLPSPEVARSRRFVFSPRSDFPKTPPAFRRLLPTSPHRRSSHGFFGGADRRPVSDIDDVRESDESSIPPFIPSPPKKKTWLERTCGCFGKTPTPEDETERISAEHAHWLRSLEPTYEPKSPLLPSLPPNTKDRICLVLDLDETLVHSSFDPFPSGSDFSVPLEMPGDKHTVYVKKRPFVDEFLATCSQSFEVVVFTASLALYANPVMDVLDPSRHVKLRLYREHCVLVGGCYVKDMRKLGRDLKRVFILDNSPLSYALQPENAIPISSWYDDENDRELEKTLSRLEQAKNLKDVRQISR